MTEITIEDDMPLNKLEVKIDVLVTRLIEETLYPSTIEMVIAVDILEMQLFDNLQKFETWIEEVVYRSIICECSNEAGISAFLTEDGLRFDNNLMITPMLPVDFHLASLFQSKLEAFLNETGFVSEIVITSTESRNYINTFYGDLTHDLPEMSEWMPGKNWFDKPWWKRDDMSMIDFTPTEKSDLTIRPAWAPLYDELINNSTNTPPPTNIIRPNFKPKVIK